MLSAIIVNHSTTSSATSTAASDPLYVLKVKWYVLTIRMIDVTKEESVNLYIAIKTNQRK